MIDPQRADFMHHIIFEGPSASQRRESTASSVSQQREFKADREKKLPCRRENVQESNRREENLQLLWATLVNLT